MKEHELKPCPFCGAKVSIRQCCSGHKGNGEFTATYEIKCPDCRIEFRFESIFTLENGMPVFKQNGYEKCVESWNRRVNDENAL